MSSPLTTPEASMQRLSRYHCFVGQLLESDDAKRVTSRTMSEQLGMSEETVRRDLSFIGAEGRPGAGYDPAVLHRALGEFLGLSAHHPFVAVGSREMLQGLSMIFPAESFGLRPVAYYSVGREDVGSSVGGIEIRHLSEVSELDRSLGATIALVACDPSMVSETLESLDAAGVHAALMLTPMLRPLHPEGMNVTYFRIPCAMKSLAGSIKQPASSCAETCCAQKGQ